MGKKDTVLYYTNGNIKTEVEEYLSKEKLRNLFPEDDKIKFVKEQRCNRSGVKSKRTRYFTRRKSKDIFLYHRD